MDITKKIIGSIIACTVLSTICTNAQVIVPDPFLFWNFNSSSGTSGEIVQSTGTATMDLTMYNKDGTNTNMLGSAGSGVSGGIGDRALDLTSATGMGGTEYVGGGAMGSGLAGLLPVNATLQSFTITGWFNASIAMASNAHIVNEANGDTNGFRVSGNSNARLSVDFVGTEDRKSASTGNNTYSGTDTWIFFAVVYDNSGPNGVISYYTGLTNQAVSLVSSNTFAVGDLKPGTAALTVGNASNGAKSRPFKGYIDDIGIWLSEDSASGALSQSQLEALRTSQIPEPSTVALILISGLAGLVFLKRKRAW